MTGPPRTRPQPWDPKDDAKLTSLWCNGLPTAEIGRHLGRSKNSIIGRAHRLELPPRPSPLVGADPDKSRRVRDRRRQASLPSLPPLPCGEIVGQDMPRPVVREPARPQGAPPGSVCQPRTISIFQNFYTITNPAYRERVTSLTITPPPWASPCCWPIGDPGAPGFHFCDAPAAPLKPYCEEHCKIAYIRVPA